jgi:hypothetical protein
VASTFKPRDEATMLKTMMLIPHDQKHE